ncbi:hypothetical protein GCM10007392_36580 [Saccharospirillum salsuginis]|uniref:Uncharacterized protein n=1 Tax=Saccharospirillum salsuginis TaxID=418750 RepID=A0A918KIS4_9GAMM|nr:hypothetical protein GCM10007392_36580 [Saccharospirillum salsuginis]
MTDERLERDFYLREPDEQQAFLDNTWCNQCQEMDLGMTDPVEFEFKGRVFIEGRCQRCGAPVTTEIAEDDDIDE